MLRLFSPAKINFFLRILFKRPDGYHHLSSVFQTVSLGDCLEIGLHDRDELTSTDPALPIDSSNLILKAIELFRNKTSFKGRFKAHLIKRIPIQAGLGGGSSNAATTLWACNQLSKASVPIATLQQWSGEIGSDIPFFFSSGTAYCTGRGEVVNDLPPLKECSLWIIKPQGGLSTPEVFHRLNFSHTIPEEIAKRDLDAFISGFPSYFNDLEKPAFEMKPELQQLKSLLLENGFEVALMSGSGSALFCLGQGCVPRLTNLTVFNVRSINRSPLNWYSE